MTDKTTPDFVFDATSHAYTLSGVALPSVTGILRAAGMYPNVEWYTPDARERGTRVHEYTAALDEGWLDESAIPEIVRPYLDAYKDFLSTSGFKPTLIEHRVYSQS